MSAAYVDDHRLILDGKDITDFCGEITLTDTLSALSAELSFTIFVSEWDKYVPKLGITPGAKVQVVNHEREVFSGRVVIVSLDGTATAYDNGWYLNKNQIIFQCVKLPAEEAIKQMIVKGGVNPGEIASLPTPISGVWIAETPADILSEILEACTRETGKQYHFRVKEGRLQIRELTREPITAWHKPAENIAAFRITWALGKVSGEDSINNNFFNSAYIVAEENGNIHVGAYGSNAASVEKYGMVQRMETVSEDPGDAALRQQIKTMLETYDRVTGTRTVEEIWGADEVESGVVLDFNSPAFGLTGLHRVTQVTHSYQGKGHTMSLELEALEQPRAVSGTQDTVTVIGLPDDLGKDTEEKTTTGKTGKIKVNGKVVPALFTAYYPANTAEEGGFYDCVGKRLDPSKRTCAAPEEIPVGSKITVLDTNTERDGQTYEINDRGGKIKIEADGRYHIDLLMRSASECNEWGVKPGNAVIDDGTEVLEFESAAEREIAAFLDVARAEVGYREYGSNGNKYGEWAGRNYDLWCVFFVCWCASKAGAPIPTNYGHVDEMVGYFRPLGKYHSVASGYAPKPGDLMIQEHVHIGIVESADGQHVYTIEGNHSDRVAQVTRSYGEISGFCSPWEET